VTASFSGNHRPRIPTTSRTILSPRRCSAAWRTGEARQGRRCPDRLPPVRTATRRAG
jgi:hypothetical protein